MQKITVKEIKGPLGRGEKKFFAVVDEKGAEFTTFDTKIQNVSPGSVLEIELKIEGKYINIVEWKVIEEGKPTQALGSPTTDRIRMYADFKIAAVQVAGRLAAAGKIEEKDIPPCANSIYQWLTSRDKVQPIPAQTTEEAWEGISHNERDSGTIKTMGDLFTACLAAFNMQRTDVIKELGYSNQGDIEESPADCYRTIFRIVANNKSPLNNPSREEKNRVEKNRVEKRRQGAK